MAAAEVLIGMCLPSLRPEPLAGMHSWSSLAREKKKKEKKKEKKITLSDGHKFFKILPGIHRK